MSISDFFFGRSQNENKNRRGIKLNRRAVRTRNLAMEPLETRDLLSVTTGLIDDSSYAELRAQYPDFNLPANQSTLNVMTVDLDEGATELKLEDLKSAITQAGESTKPDLILVKTTDSADSVIYTSNTDEITLDIDSTQFGSTTIISWGTNKLTLNANQQCRGMLISSEYTVVNLGNLVIQNGSDEIGGGIFVNSGILTISNSIISENSATSGEGGGIRVNNAGNLSIINSIVSDNMSSLNGGGLDLYNNSSLLLKNSSVINNTSNRYGGGIGIADSSAVIMNSIISNNSAESVGGGIYNYYAYNLTIANSEIISNTSHNAGGGIRTEGTGTITLTNCKISNNLATNNGGGIDIYHGSYLSMIDCIVSYNNSGRDGGGISFTNSSNTIFIKNSFIISNTASSVGGGIINGINGTIIIDNSEISGNSGSGIFNKGKITVTNCTITRNNTVSNGGGIYNTSSTTINIRNSIVVNNSSTDIYKESGAIINAYNTLSSFTSWSSGSNIVYNNSKPLFVSTTDYHLAENSQAINKGNNSYAVDSSEQPLTTDLAGIPRIIGGTVDIGAYEYDSRIPLSVPEFTVTVNRTFATVNIMPVDNANSYRIEYSSNDDFTNSAIIDTQTTENTLDGLQEAQTYYIRIKSIGNRIDTVYTDSDYSATQSFFISITLDTPVIFPLKTYNNTVVVADWSTVDHADGYTFEYQLDGSDNWITTTGLLGTSEAFVGNIGSTYNVRIKANGSGDYSDSDYSAIESITLTVPATPITGITLSNYSPIVGSTITATLNPTDATANYQWYSGETLIEGENTSSFIVTEDQIGQTITCVATGTGDYTGTVSMTTAVVPVPVTALDAPADVALSVYNATVTASWSAVENASSYTLEYKPVDAENWTALPGLEDTTASFVGVSGTMYNVRVKAVGTGDYSDSPYAEINTDKPTGPVVAINANKVTVSWVDDSPAADSVRYRVAGTTRWTVKKLNAGITEMSFNATIGANYEIEVLLDQQENNVLQGSAIVLDQPKLTSIRNELKDDTFQVNVTNYAAKNLAANVKQAIVSVNGVMTTLKIADQQGETALANGGKVSFSNGLFTFSEMNSNTSYKVMISFSDGHSVSKTSSALTVKTLKAPYLPPVIVSANAVSDTSIAVTWETAYGKNSTTPAQKYTVQYSTDGNKWTNATTGATGNSYTIQRLKGGMEYQVRVLATKDNVFEASVPSEVLAAETLTAPKTAIEKNSIKDDSFQLNVTNYQNTNLPKATVVNVKSDKFGETVINLENGAGSAAFDNGMTVAFNEGALTFANAPSNTQQKVQVNFSDGVCTTAWSAALTVKTTIAPYNKPNLTNATAVSSTSVLVEWSPVVGKNTDIPAQSYTVQYSTDGNRWINANTKVVGTSFTINGLKTGTNYLVAVIANKDSRFNASLPSESLEVRML